MNRATSSLACRACGAPLVHSFVDLGETPLANAFPREQDLDRLGALLPEFTLRYTLERGLEELYQKMVEHDFNESDFRGDRFVRVRTLHNRLSRLDPL